MRGVGAVGSGVSPVTGGRDSWSDPGVGVTTAPGSALSVGGVASGSGVGADVAGWSGEAPSGSSELPPLGSPPLSGDA